MISSMFNPGLALSYTGCLGPKVEGIVRQYNTWRHAISAVAVIVVIVVTLVVFSVVITVDTFQVAAINVSHKLQLSFSCTNLFCY